MPEIKFPKNFYWGAATSAHQVEGGNFNDWSEWEKKNAERLAKEAQKHYQKWQQEKFPEMLKPANYISGQACDHYHLYEQDFDLARELGHNTHRFSIEWSRIEPKEGEFNEEEIEHYRKVIKALWQRGIEPFVTLWHYTHPIWFTSRGGWLHPKANESFLRFIEKVVSEYKDVRYWIISNEAETVVRHGYIQAIRMPEERSILKAFKVLKKLVQVHKDAYDLIHRIRDKSVKVGFAESLVFFESYNHWPHNLILKYILNWYRNKQFVPKVIDWCDFIGLNYYFHSRVRFNPFVSWRWFQYNENKQGVSDMGWEIYPEGIYHMLKELKKYNKPIFITELGIADAKDKKRKKFIKDYLYWVAKAIKDGVDIRGHFYWSFMDNFEWSDGFWPRFGLIEVDYLPRGKAGKTMERKIRPSAYQYAKICKENKLDL